LRASIRIYLSKEYEKEKEMKDYGEYVLFLFYICPEPEPFFFC
jgi:hypothetical protein